MGSVATNLIKVKPEIPENLEALSAFATDLFAGLNDIVARLSVNYPGLCDSDYALEVFSLVWSRLKTEDHESRLNDAVSYLEGLGHWLGSEGLNVIQKSRSLGEQLVKVYDNVIHNIPKRVFLARWYPQHRSSSHFDHN